jgi:hypothetical protein
MSTWHEYTGNIHMHTTASDGAGTHAELAQIAAAAKLDFLIVTDHNVLMKAEEGWREGVLMLVGEEVHDPDLAPPGNHLLCLGVTEDVTSLRRDPQALIDAVHAQGGLAFLAHPHERGSKLLPETYPWRAWTATGYAGVELWNFNSEFKSYASGIVKGLLLLWRPAWFTAGPFAETLALWDRLLRERPVVAIGGSDAHALRWRLGPFTLTILPYDLCFRMINTHILTSAPFSGDLAHDRALVLDALRQGHCWIGYDGAAATHGFRFQARQGERTAIMGDALPAGSPVTFEVTLPQAGQARLLRDGQVVAAETGDSLRFESAQPGAYRVAVDRRAWGRQRAWIFSNPIYVRAGSEQDR